MNIKSIVMAAAVLSASSFGASAATLSAGDFTIEGQTTSGNCPTTATPCILLANSGRNSTATLTFNGGEFDLSGFLFSLQGSGAQVTATSNTGGVFANTNPQGSFTGLEADLTLDGGFTGITSVVFTNTGNGTVRIGGLFGESPDVPEVPLPASNVSEVPLPASGVLLLAAIGLGLAARRKKA